jgi:hypothetical protein
MHRDGLADRADIQRQAHRRYRPRCQPRPQVGSQASRSRQQVGCGFQDHPPRRSLGPRLPRGTGITDLVWGGTLGWAGRGAVQQRGGEAVQHAGVDAARHHRDDLRVAVITRAGGGLAGPGSLGFGGTGQSTQPVQIQVQHDLRRLPRPLRQTPRPDQPPAGLARRLHHDLRHIRIRAASAT